ncbi:MAG: hypothetical protein LQ351_001243 [Letrouitia transgressa]|nr:MAG: hypothetical protein LQ351_001243 [Letrouitia transgressa]
MTETSSTGLKRPYPGDDLHNDQKRARSNYASPAPGSNGVPKPDNSRVVADMRAKAAAIAARLQSQKAASSGSTSPAPQSPSSASPPATTGNTMSKLEQLKARVAAATAKSSATQRTASPPQAYQPPIYDDEISRTRGGLDVGLHPALLADSVQDAKPVKNKLAPFATTMANRRHDSPAGADQKSSKGKKQLDLSGPLTEETRSNRYLDPSLGAQTGSSRIRQSKQLVFNQKGKYIQMAGALRRQAALEAMKRRIAESTRRAGIDEDLETEKGFLVEEPTNSEWWDEELVIGADYSNISKPRGLKIDTPDSIITRLCQHPVALAPPQEAHVPAPKPMHLTPKEQAKVRRQRRQADLKEQQAKVRLGLEEPEPPKVKQSNMMRVMGEEAVKDPTKVEMRVMKEIAGRKEVHEKANKGRQLTKDAQHEKLAKQQEKDAQKGIYGIVFKIDNLSDGRHRFQVDKNAKDNSLTGIMVLNPKQNLVVVEGGIHSITAYKKLMTNRVKWTESSGPATVREGNKQAVGEWMEKPEEQDYSKNRCQLVWEGELKNRQFRKWSTRVCETETLAREALSRGKMDSMWVLAKSFK